MVMGHVAVALCFPPLDSCGFESCLPVMAVVQPPELWSSCKQRTPILLTPTEFLSSPLIELVPESPTVAWRMCGAETSIRPTPPIQVDRPKVRVKTLQTRIYSFAEE